MSEQRHGAFLAELPEGYDDGRASFCLLPDNTLVVLHPDHLPLQLDEKAVRFVPINTPAASGTTE